MHHVDYSRDGAAAVITISNPPVNSISHPVRAAFLDALDRAAADDGVRAIVVAGAGGLFSAGADIREFGTPAARAAPQLRDIIAAVEASAKPVIAAIGGLCLGGGFELALGCHYRVARADARVGLPEVMLGLLPGAGGTQRLPRLVGVETALNMILSGERVPARDLERTRLFERVVDGDPVRTALDLVDSLAKQGPRRISELTLVEPNLEALCEFALMTVKAKAPLALAPQRCIECVKAAAKPFAEGAAIERRLFLELMQTPESQGLRHSFFAERAAGKVADIPESTPLRPLTRAAVIGAGTMGGGIAICFLNAGIPTWLLETDQAALDRGVARITAIYDAQVKKGKLAIAERDKRMALLLPVLKYDAIASADIVIEAVFERMDVKLAVFAELDRVMKPGAILATNTSTLDVNAIARSTRRPADVLGTHFFSPANVMRLLEIVRGRDTAKDALATALALGKTLRKVPVVSGVCDGFIGNRMLEQYTRQANYMLEEGASPRQIDAAMEAFGFAMGPFKVGDLAGNDIGWNVRKRRRAEKPGYRFSTLPDKLCELGRFGQKTGAGWYEYPDGRKPLPSKTVDELIAAHRREIGVTPRKIDDAEIVDRLVYALVNEGARILDERIAARSSDIDVCYVAGYGFPAMRGGPMFHAELVGLPLVQRRMREFARNPHGDAEVWKPAALIDRLVASGGSFESAVAPTADVSGQRTAGKKGVAA
ncbi:MAG TPA: 3-hydroxyacyl-CoA dehydrogenase NAD-binding domain-containing protein [Steroidobacteraceae bacterium]|nr:3-hydroxyacyl-CoA dehydrogenase NAD-binding domain-containing protein [Steroidobacteraceae bacterium]